MQLTDWNQQCSLWQCPDQDCLEPYPVSNECKGHQLGEKRQALSAWEPQHSRDLAAGYNPSDQSGTRREREKRWSCCTVRQWNYSMVTEMHTQTPQQSCSVQDLDTMFLLWMIAAAGLVPGRGADAGCFPPALAMGWGQRLYGHVRSYGTEWAFQAGGRKIMSSKSSFSAALGLIADDPYFG